MHSSPSRRRPALTAVATLVALAVLVSAVALLTRPGHAASPATAAIADAITSPAAPATATTTPATPATPAATATPAAALGSAFAVMPGIAGAPGVSSTLAGPPSGATPLTTTPGTTPRSQAATFPARSGSQISGPSPLKDVLQDQGISVPLPDGRSLWIFADTTQASTTPYFFVTSSAAVSRKGSVKLGYAATGKGLPVEFLPRTASERNATSTSTGTYTAVWPTGATMLPDGRVLISYASYRVTTSPPSYTLLGAGLYTFRYRSVSSFSAGAQATRVATGLWSAAEGAIGSPVYANGYVYFTTCENLQCYSVRSTVSGLTSHASYRWWTGTTWSAGRADRAPMAYGSSKPGLSPSMAYLPAYGVYATAGTAVGHVSGTGLLWVAPNPWGPWSKAASFRLPNCPSAGCYGLHLHPSESIGGRVRISYATSGIGPYVRVTDLSVTIRGTSSVQIH